jgi:hypothetical protein
VRTHGWPYPFASRPWEEMSTFFGDMTRRHPGFGHMAAVTDSVLTSGSAGLLAGCTSMHDLIVVSMPVLDPPYNVIVVRAPGSLHPPRPGQVLIEHLACTGRNDRIERPVAQAVPLFWRFVIEKCGVHPAQSSGPDQNSHIGADS